MIGFAIAPGEVEQIKRQFSALGDRVQKRVFINVLKKNTRALENKMKELAPKSKYGSQGNRLESRNHPAGYLKASIGTIVSKGTNFPTIWVKPRFKGKWDPWYAHFPMAGTKKMKVAPNPFVDKAWEEAGEGVKAGLLSDLEKQIQAEINKL
jgi:HK97 gp10 family phage protein